MHAIWKGTISFGLVSIRCSCTPRPRRRTSSFTRYIAPMAAECGTSASAASTGNRCATRTSQRVRGEPDELVVLTDEDLAKLPLTTVAPSRYWSSSRRSGRPDLVPQGVLPGTRSECRQAVPAVAGRADKDRPGRDRQGGAAPTRTVGDAADPRRVMVLNTMLWPDEVRKPGFDFLGNEYEAKARNSRWPTHLSTRCPRTSRRCLHRPLPRSGTGGDRRQGGGPGGSDAGPTRRSRGAADRLDGRVARLGGAS